MAILKLNHISDGHNAIIDIHDKLSIGRNPDNDITIPSTEISRHHCLISVDEDSNYYVKDLNSSNGTFVNKEKIDRIQVHHEDILHVGMEKFVFVLADNIELQKEELSPTTKFKSTLLNQSSQEIIERVCIKSFDNTQTFHCQANSIYTIGRSELCDISLDDNAVSKTHARIDVGENSVAITDLNSSNGSFVNKEKITRKELKDEDSILIGSNTFVVSLEWVSRNYYNSLNKRSNIITIDLLEDHDNMVNLFTNEYNINVLLEVERQTLLFCQEFEQLYRTGNHSNSKKSILVKFLELFSQSLQIVDGATLDILSRKDSDQGSIHSDRIQKISQLIGERGKTEIVYFEEVNPDNPEWALLNGISVYFGEDLQLIVFGIPFENILYLVYGSRWLSRLRVDKKVDINETL